MTALPDTFSGYCWLANAILLARLIWIVGNAFRVEGQAYLIKYEADLILAQVELEQVKLKQLQLEKQCGTAGSS